MFLESEPGIIGFSVNFMSQALCAFAMAGFVRSRLPAVQIIFGGGLVTSWMHIPGLKIRLRGWWMTWSADRGKIFAEYLREDKKSGSAGIYDFSPFEMDQYLFTRPGDPVQHLPGCYWRKCAFCPEKYEHSRYQPLNAGYAVELVTTAAKGSPGPG